MIPQRRKILHCLGSLNPGGVETWMLGLLRHLDTTKFQFDFCTLGAEAGCYASVVERLGSVVHRCPRHPSSRVARRFRQILRQGEYDVVHGHVHFFSGALLRWAALEGVPVRIAHSHTSEDDQPTSFARSVYKRLMMKWIDDYATHGLAVSRKTAAALFTANWESDPRIRVVYPGIDTQPFSDALQGDPDRPAAKVGPMIGHVGNFVAAKNHAFLSKIMEQILKLRPDIHFLLIGDGPLRSKIEKQVRETNLARNVHFLGTRNDVPLLLQHCDAFLFPSRWEGLPCAVLEAQAAGLPCVISQEIAEEVVVFPEQVLSLSILEDAQHWAARTIEMVNRGKRDAGECLRAFRETNFSIERSLSSLLAIYSSNRVQARAAN